MANSLPSGFADAWLADLAEENVVRAMPLYLDQVVAGFHPADADGNPGLRLALAALPAETRTRIIAEWGLPGTAERFEHEASRVLADLLFAHNNRHDNRMEALKACVSPQSHLIHPANLWTAYHMSLGGAERHVRVQAAMAALRCYEPGAE